MFCNFDALGAGVGLESLGLTLVLGDGIGLTFVLIAGDGFIPLPGGGGGAGRFFLLCAENELSLLLVDNAGDGGDRSVTLE